MFDILCINMDEDYVHSLACETKEKYTANCINIDSKEKFQITFNSCLIDIILFDIDSQTKIMDFMDFESYIHNQRMSFNIPVVILYNDDSYMDKNIYNKFDDVQYFIKKSGNIQNDFTELFIILDERHKIYELSEKLIQQHEELQNMDRHYADKMSNLYLQIMYSLISAVEAKDRYTSNHSKRVAQYCKMIGERLHFSYEQQFMLYNAALLHDIGKVGVTDVIINKPEKLDTHEIGQVRLHTIIGYSILKNLTDMPWIYKGARWHHERWDGSGYPDGLKGEEIPEIARIIGIADAYDAMTSNRSYRQYMPQDVVRMEIIEGRGTQFDPNITDIMLDIIDNDKDYQLREQD